MGWRTIVVNKNCKLSYKNDYLIVRSEELKMIHLSEISMIIVENGMVSITSYLINELAKILKQNGVEIGQNRLFERLRNDGYLIKQKGENWNLPTQKSMELGLFEVKKTVINKPDGTPITRPTTKVTGKGQIYFVNKFLDFFLPFNLLKR